MTILPLYTGEDVTLSPKNNDGRHLSEYVRLIADEGKSVTDGNLVLQCVDILSTDIGNWEEVEAHEEIDDSEAINILLGGSS